MTENKKQRTRRQKWTRRAFIGTGGLAVTGLVIGVAGNAYVNKALKKYSGEGMGEGESLNAWLRIAPDNTITVAVPRAEMGQGVYTSIPQLIAEELEVDMSRIKVIHPQPESPYANTFMVTQTEPNIFKGYSMAEKLYAFLPVVGTGGSTTIPDGWNNMRYAGATAREMLIKAAADQWSVEPSDCRAENGFVINKGNNERLSYGDLAAVAKEIDLGELPELKKKADFKVIGQPVQRLDIPEKVTGDAEFSLDVRMEGLLYAAMRHPETIGGKINAINNEEEVSKMAGVKKVVLTEYGAAVIADNTWRATTAAKFLDLDEEDGGNSGISTGIISSRMTEILDEEPIAVSEKEGDVDAALNDSDKVIESTYEVPYLAHATMEPLNCTVKVADDNTEAEVWVGHQASSIARDMVNQVTNVDKGKITINTTYLGGGFGRRAEPDFLRKAAAVAMHMPGKPVMTVFTREEDMRNDMYRPAAMSRFKAAISQDGEIEAWDNMMALQSVSNSALSRIMPAMAPSPAKDEATSEGARHLPYSFKNRRVSFGNIDLPIQVGFWRSVGSSQNAFFTESFMDECAHAALQDPYLFRKSKLKDHPRFEAVLDKVAEISNWASHPGVNKFRGIALHKSFGSIVGQVAEIEKVGDQEYKIDKFYCVIDCGNIVNPDTIKAQMEGGINFGLSAALYGEITWTDGSVDQYNFPQYEMVRLNHAPNIEVHIMDVDEYPGGVGEPGTPPAAPALTNALFAATGNRIKKLPIVKQGYKFV